MKRVAEIIHIVPEERDNFLKGAITPDPETKRFLWDCGVRKQQYFALNELIFMTFEYAGMDFQQDMARMAAYLESKGHLVEKRRRDIPEELRETENWWAPVKRIAALLDVEPEKTDSDSHREHIAMLDGGMAPIDPKYDIAYDEDDWTEGIHI